MTGAEEWRSVVGYEADYEVSDRGRIRAYRHGRWRTKAKLLKPRQHPAGYLIISLSRGGKKKYFYLHNVIAAAFLGPKPSGYEVHHKNHVKTDNSIANLVYCTPSENIREMYRCGPAPCSKLSADQVREIRLLLPTATSAVIAKRFGVPWNTIHKIRSGRGYAWVD
jgi:hypothetical protein